MTLSIDNIRVTGTLRHANDFSPNITRVNLAQQSEEEFAIPLETTMPHRGMANGAGEGITESADNFVTSVEKTGSIITTTILVEIDGLDGGGLADDIIGAGGGAKESHLGQITAARNGTIIAGRVTCLELPTGGNVDIDLYCATEDTGKEDEPVTGLTETILLNNGDWTLGQTSYLTALPVVDEYLYLANGTATAATYTAGILLIELWGTDTTTDLDIVRGAFGTNAISLQTEDLQKKGSQTRVARFSVVLPPEYVDGQTVKIRVVGGMITTVADTTCTVDVNCYLNDEDNTVSADLCTTVATTINTLLSAAATTVDFTITAATLTAGSLLDLRVSVICNDAAGATAVIGAITKVALLVDTQG
jgi:hypothetical protein